MDEKEGRPIVIEDNYGARWCFRYRYGSRNAAVATNIWSGSVSHHEGSASKDDLF